MSRVGARNLGTRRRLAGTPRPEGDTWLLASVLALLGLGLVMVYSASISIAERTVGDGNYYLWRQLVAVGVGFLLMYIVMHTPMRLWEAAGPYLLIMGMVLLALVLIPGIGVTVNGSSRWLRLGVVNLQPSELMKLFMVIYVAGYFVRKQEELHNFTQGVVIIGVVVAAVGVLLLQEPDLGAVVVICLTVLGMLFLAGVRFWHFGIVTVAGLGGMAVLTLISPYRYERVIAFLDPWADPFNSGFQLVQALIAFGRGEWLGVGLGASVQKLYYLPAAHTDFIFAVTAEELGLLGVLAVIALFGVLIVRAFLIAREAERVGLLYPARLAQGIGLLLGLQAMVNMGVNMGVLPTKGLTLPFMSYGGSSIVMCFVAIGLLLAIERETRAHAWGVH
ncbi:MAG: putative lipid II flippase FtsW [Acidiferrobacterales bacterium]